MRVSFPGKLALAVVIVAAPVGAAWAQQPPRVALPEAVWTPSANAPDGLLTSLEGERHDRFIKQAKAGDIDIVFFGTTDTEMWLWADRGRSVWDQELAVRKAAGFGSQGTRFESLMWRMRNGELSGYQAKVVVLQLTSGSGLNSADSLADLAKKEAGIIAEVRSRQPQAKILIFAGFPRGADTNPQMAEANAAIATLADNDTVFYIDIGKRFFRPDGSFNYAMWSLDLANRGIQTPAFKVWAEELQPWLTRFVR
jgi:hypothetical protein